MFRLHAPISVPTAAQEETVVDGSDGKVDKPDAKPSAKPSTESKEGTSTTSVDKKMYVFISF